MFKFITQRPLWLNLLTGLLLALALFIIFIFSLNWITHHNESKTVPSVVGKSFDEAETILEKAGFEVEIQDSIYVDTVKPMKVLRQVPESDDVVKVNRTVFLTINRAVPPMVEMPNLNGFSYRSAEMELRNLGLRVGDTIYKANFARNSVLEQRYKGEIIAAGTKLRMGSVISFVLGNGVGNEKFLVPSLVGMRFCDARAMIESHGLIIGSVVSSGGITDSCNAYIFKQNPERFDEAKKVQYIRTGQTMDVWIQVEKPVIDSLAIPSPNQ
ncbi:MAG: PASTA domain-containing protein [Bacteroidota bacterium]|nr:PASTA domain-containing protein [Bacteroidota bacterium]